MYEPDVEQSKREFYYHESNNKYKTIENEWKNWKTYVRYVV